MSGLTKHETHQMALFARHYCTNLNISAAYEAAGFEPDYGNASRYFKREDVQEAIQLQMDRITAKLDINIEKTLKHIAAIAYANPLDCIAFHETTDIDENGFPVTTVHKSRVKSPSEIPAWAAVCMTEIEEKADADGGISMKYKFENKLPALKILLDYLERTSAASKQTEVRVTYQGPQQVEGPKVEVKF